MEITQDMKPPRLSDRNFGLVFAAFFAVITVVAFLFFGRLIVWAAILCLAFLVISLTLPGLLLPLNRLWEQAARRLGVFNNHLLLGLAFYGLILPVGAIMKLIGRDPMERKMDASTDTYLTPVRRKMNAETAQDLF